MFGGIWINAAFNQGLYVLSTTPYCKALGIRIGQESEHRVSGLFSASRLRQHQLFACRFRNVRHSAEAARSRGMPGPCASVEPSVPGVDLARIIQQLSIVRSPPKGGRGARPLCRPGCPAPCCPSPAAFLTT